MSEKQKPADPTTTMQRLMYHARLVSAPLIGLSTADQREAMNEIVAMYPHHPVVQWDAARGITHVNTLGEATLNRVKIDSADTIEFGAAMLALPLLPEKALVFVHNAHRQLTSAEPSSTAQAVQAVANLRDDFKVDHRTLVLMAPSFVAPMELKHDIVSLEHAMPDGAAIEQMVRELHASAGLTVPTGDDMRRAVEAATGLSMFEAETAVSLSLTDHGLDQSQLWERKRTIIEKTPGLSVHRGTETFDDLRGLEAAKERFRQHINAKTPVGVVVWIDEGADVFSNVEQDTSGVKTDQQRVLLTEMEQNKWRGVLCVGVPGAGKSAIAQAFGNEANVLTIALDLAGMESKYVGESEANLRQAIRVIKSIGHGRAFFVLTCNSLKGIRPQFQARFRRGTFFFDLPTKDERDAIWKLYERKFEIPKQPRPEDDGWVGREIRECCESAWDTGVSLVDAAKFIVPVSRSRAAEIEEMRKEAHMKFLDASHVGEYHYRRETMERQVRAITLPGSDEAARKKMN